MEVSEIAESVGSMLLNASGQAVFLAIMVATICRLAGKRLTGRWQFALWGLVFVRLACPALPSSQFSVLNLLPVHNEPITSVHEVNPISVESPTNEFVVPFLTMTSQPEKSTPNSTTQRQEDPSATAMLPQVPAAAVKTRPRLSRPDSINYAWPAAFSIWAIVTGILLTRQFLRWRRLRTMAVAWQVVTDVRVIQIMDECRRQVGIRRPVTLFQSDRSIGPAMLGLLHPQIILPKAMVNSATADELRMLFLHELNHVRRADVFWDSLAGLLVALHWFNPVAWWAFARLRDAREKACDAAALSCLGREQAGAYGQLLIDIADRHGADRREAVLVGAMGQTRFLKRRIEMIVEYRKSTWKHSLFGASILAVLVACGLTSAQSLKPFEKKVEANKNEVTAKQDAADKFRFADVTAPLLAEKVRSVPSIRGSNYLVVPWKKTELQMWLIGSAGDLRENCKAHVLIDGHAFYTGDGKLDQNALDWKQLANQLRPFADRKKGVVDFSVMGIPDGDVALRLSQWALTGFGEQQAGFYRAYVSQSSGQENNFWDLIASSQKKMKGRTEGAELPIGNELVQVYPVQTFLSDLKSGNSDCVVRIVPRLEKDTGKSLPPEIRKAILKYVPQVKVYQKGKLYFRVTCAKEGKNTAKWFVFEGGSKDLARSLSYEDATGSLAEY